MNKYETWYNNIVDRAKNRSINTYKEIHHIIPRSLGGTNLKENLVELTAREHFICHWLLVKMHTGEARSKMINALYMMRAEGTYQHRYTSIITSRVYSKLREEFSQYISKRNSGRKQPFEEKEKQIAAMTGRTRSPFSTEWKNNLSKNHKSKNPNYNTAHSVETRQKISEKMKGRKQDPVMVAIRAKKQKSLNLKREKKLCPYCNRLIAVNAYARWHGDNCKLNTVVEEITQEAVTFN